MTTNIINAKLGTPDVTVWSDWAWQYDYGQILKLSGVDLPAAYEVHFSNQETGGTTITQIGNEDGVTVPDEFFLTGADIYVWIFLHAGLDDGETVYKVVIPVKDRPRPSNGTPTPVQQDAITEAIAALNAGVERAEAAAAEWENMSATAETLPAGSSATASYSEGVLSLGIPKGDQGIQGEQGPQGQDGPQGPEGPTGPTGPTGATPNLTIGTVSTLPAGSDATATITGTPENPVLSLGIPKGNKGDKGNTGNTGATGNGIASIEKTGTSGNVDTYTVTYTNGQTYTFQVTNGAVTSVSGKTGAVVLDGGDVAFDDSQTYANGTIGKEVSGLLASAQQISTNTNDIANLKSDVDDLEEAIDALEAAKKFGVSGIGQSASQLTRIWDAVGMVAQVGTDGDNSAVINNFDNVAPFNRRKCVGHWELDNGKPSFVVQAYFGDADYTEDGTMGDYVAVECPLAYYYMVGDVLGVSAYPWPGWRPFDIFCQGHDPAHTIPYAYLPAYALALKDGKAVSLPGLDNYQGDYKGVIDACRTYAGDVGAKAISQPMAVNFYEWALFTVEFAQQDSQKAMRGCADLRHNNDDRATLRSDGKWLLSNYFASRVAGEYISLQPTNIDINAVAWYASHKIVSIIRCDASGNESSSGTYQLMEVQDLGTGREYEIGSDYRIAARPYRTGECNGVSTPSGSPVSNSDGYYPMKYRWRENVFANQYKTICDLFSKRVGTGDDDYKLEWYFLPVPEDYTPSTSSKPDATDLASDAFVKLDVETAHENYLNGYIKSRKYSQVYPDIWIPFETTGGSGTTYYADYALLVLSAVVRAVRLGGNWSYGAAAGFSYVNGYAAPSSGSAHYGGDLFFPQ